MCGAGLCEPLHPCPACVSPSRLSLSHHAHFIWATGAGLRTPQGLGSPCPPPAESPRTRRGSLALKFRCGCLPWLLPGSFTCPHSRVHLPWERPVMNPQIHM